MRERRLNRAAATHHRDVESRERTGLRGMLNRRRHSPCETWSMKIVPEIHETG